MLRLGPTRVGHSGRLTAALIVVLSVAAALVVAFIPPEERLGSTVRFVILHGAFARVGMVTFAAAGLLGVAALTFAPRLHRWCLGTQKAAVAVWVVYIASSMVATYLAWGVAIAWEEPRVVASGKVLILSLAFLILVLWVGQEKFTAVANTVLAVLSWFAVKSAGVVQHPFSPIGGSEMTFKVYFGVLSLILLAVTYLVVHWFSLRSPASAPAPESFPASETGRDEVA
jgi:hypothetical protein